MRLFQALWKERPGCPFVSAREIFRSVDMVNDEARCLCLQVEQGIRELVDKLESLKTGPTQPSAQGSTAAAAENSANYSSRSLSTGQPPPAPESSAVDEEQIERHFGETLDSETAAPLRAIVTPDIDLHRSIAGIDLDGLLARLREQKGDALGVNDGAFLRGRGFVTRVHATCVYVEKAASQAQRFLSNAGVKGPDPLWTDSEEDEPLRPEPPPFRPDWKRPPDTAPSPSAVEPSHLAAAAAAALPAKAVPAPRAALPTPAAVLRTADEAQRADRGRTAEERAPTRARPASARPAPVFDTYGRGRRPRGASGPGTGPAGSVLGGAELTAPPSFRSQGGGARMGGDESGTDDDDEDEVAAEMIAWRQERQRVRPSSAPPVKASGRPRAAPAAPVHASTGGPEAPAESAPATAVATPSAPPARAASRAPAPAPAVAPAPATASPISAPAAAAITSANSDVPRSAFSASSGPELPTFPAPAAAATAASRQPAAEPAVKHRDVPAAVAALAAAAATPPTKRTFGGPPAALLVTPPADDVDDDDDGLAGLLMMPGRSSAPNASPAGRPRRFAWGDGTEALAPGAVGSPSPASPAPSPSPIQQAHAVEASPAAPPAQPAAASPVDPAETLRRLVAAIEASAPGRSLYHPAISLQPLLDSAPPTPGNGCSLRIALASRGALPQVVRAVARDAGVAAMALTAAEPSVDPPGTQVVLLVATEAKGAVASAAEAAASLAGALRAAVDARLVTVTAGSGWTQFQAPPAMVMAAPTAHVVDLVPVTVDAAAQTTVRS